MLTEVRRLFIETQDAVAEWTSQLKAVYVFPPGSMIDAFLADHISLLSILRDAVGPLKSAFGDDNIFTLELSIDEDDSMMLYGIVVWRESVQSAARALDHFEEDWWLDRMTSDTADLAFTYRLA
jgi:hypothetical protein